MRYHQLDQNMGFQESQKLKKDRKRKKVYSKRKWVKTPLTCVKKQTSKEFHKT